jgi:hypothetical protein
MHCCGSFYHTTDTMVKIIMRHREDVEVGTFPCFPENFPNISVLLPSMQPMARSTCIGAIYKVTIHVLSDEHIHFVDGVHAVRDIRNSLEVFHTIVLLKEVYTYQFITGGTSLQHEGKVECGGLQVEQHVRTPRLFCEAM